MNIRVVDRPKQVKSHTPLRGDTYLLKIGEKTIVIDEGVKHVLNEQLADAPNEEPKAKRLPGVENGRVSLEVMECVCGFHMGLDATYMLQVADFTFRCPSCDRQWNTATVFPEDGGVTDDEQKDTA